MQKLQENLIVFPHYTLYIADTLCNIIAFVISLLNDIIILETPLNGHFIIALCKYVTTFLSRLYNVLFDLRFTQIVSLLRIILALIQYLWIKNKNFPVGETGFQSFSIHRVPVATNQCSFVSTVLHCTPCNTQGQATGALVCSCSHFIQYSIFGTRWSV